MPSYQEEPESSSRFQRMKRIRPTPPQYVASRNFMPYYERAQTLKRMGFASYEAYLSSELWRRLRSKVLRKASWLCHACQQPKACQVHHTNYRLETLQGKDLSGLMAVCLDCHRAGEKAASGRKMGLRSANRRIKRLAKRNS